MNKMLCITIFLFFINSAYAISVESDKLKSAYGELMRLFVDESAINKQAFFDHLCALDFI